MMREASNSNVGPDDCGSLGALVADFAKFSTWFTFVQNQERSRRWQYELNISVDRMNQPSQPVPR